MSFLDKFKSKGRDGGKRANDEDIGSMFDEVVPVQPEDLVVAGAGANGGVTLDMNSPGSPLPTTLTGESSILSEVLPSEAGGDYTETRLPGDAEVPGGSGLPLIGHLPLAQQQRALFGVVAVGVVALMAGAWFAITGANRGAAQVGATGQALMQSQRLAKSVSQALLGSASAFGEVRESSEVLARNVRALKDGGENIQAAPFAAQGAIEPLMPLIDRAEKNASVVLAQQKTLTQVGQALRAINRQSSELLETAETVSSLKLQQEAGPAELSAVGQLVMLTQRIGKSANEFLTTEGVSPEAVFLLGKDLNSFREIANGLLSGSSELRLAPARDAQTKERLQQLITQYEKTRTDASAILNNLQGLVAAREAQSSVVADSEPLRQGLEDVQSKLSGTGLGGGSLFLLLLGASGLVVGGLGYLRLASADQDQRMQVADAQRQQAERQEQEAKRVNDANQAAILRLMNELQTVAEGDLTQTATVTEDITGAIADSVNYTVEELRMLVEQVQGTGPGDRHDAAGGIHVHRTAGRVHRTAARDPRNRRVGAADGRPHQRGVLAGAADGPVARQSLAAAESGLPGGAEHHRRHERDPRPDPGHRQAHQAPGRVVAGDRRNHRADLRHHRADQRAGAQRRHPGRVGRRGGPRLLGGGRGSAAAGRTLRGRHAPDRGAGEGDSDRHPGRGGRHGAIDAGRGRGTRLSDAPVGAGRHRPRDAPAAELIERISQQALQEAESANVVASNIQHIFAVTEQTGEGTRSTAQMVRELSRTAEELRPRCRGSRSREHHHPRCGLWPLPLKGASPAGRHSRDRGACLFARRRSALALPSKARHGPPARHRDDRRPVGTGLGP
jgi:twitching motility protein PilJ